jgi:hypothetical protein
MRIDKRILDALVAKQLLGSADSQFEKIASAV